eukprot:6492764-Amphidinium_carterae.3
MAVTKQTRPPPPQHGELSRPSASRSAPFVRQFVSLDAQFWNLDGANCVLNAKIIPLHVPHNYSFFTFSAKVQSRFSFAKSGDEDSDSFELKLENLTRVNYTCLEAQALE